MGVIVIDASAVVDLLVKAPHGPSVMDEIDGAHAVAAPELLVAEVVSALWRHVRAGLLSDADAELAVDNLEKLPIDLVPHQRLMRGAWALRHQVRIADGFYVALSQQLRAPLLTTDQRLIRSGPGVPILPLT